MWGEQLGRVRMINNTLEIYLIDGKKWYEVTTREERDWLIQVQRRIINSIKYLSFFKKT